MQSEADRTEAQAAIQVNIGAIFVSLELSRFTWLITSLSPGRGEKRSKHSVRAGDIAALLARFAVIRKKALAQVGRILSDYRHSGSRAGWLLGSSRTGERRD